ncbi:MAG: hypothetical protein SFT91_03630, partial [Rickettsiaceae bacterium]|nr:hypothetical protein [Rickettsiaceae bacterium]
MENPNGRFEDEWKRAFSNIEEEPNPSLWQNLENKLAEKEILIYKQKYLYLRKIAAVLLMLLVPLTIFFVYESGLKNNVEIADQRTTDISTYTKDLPSNEENGSVKIAPEKLHNKFSHDEGSAILMNKNIKEKETAIIDDSKHNDLQNRSISNSQGIQKDNPDLTPHSNHYNFIKYNRSGRAKYAENNIALNSKANNKQTGTSEAGSGIRHLFNNTNTRNDSTYEGRSLPLAAPVIAGEIREQNGFTSKDLSLENKSISYANEIHTSDVLHPDKHALPNSAENTTTSKSANSLSFFDIKSLTGKGPDISTIETSSPALKFREDKLAQEILPQKHDRVERWFVSIDFVPTYTNQNFERPASPSPNNSLAYNGSNTKMDVVEQLDILIKPDFSFSSGLGGGYRLNKRLHIESGIKYTYNQAIVITNLFYANIENATQSLVFNKVLKDEPIQNPLTMESLTDAKYSNYMLGSDARSMTQISTINIYTQYITV